MTLDSIQYVAFLAAAAIAVRASPQRHRRAVVTIASAIFYLMVSVVGLLGLALSAGLTWIAARHIADPAAHTDANARILRTVTVGLLIAIGVGASWSVIAAPTTTGSIPVLAFVVPGTQFVMLQAIAFVVDCHRERHRALGARMARYSAPDLFGALIYFPHVLAGPVVRTQRLLREFEKEDFRSPRYSTGTTLILTGLVKKRVIADGLYREVLNIGATPGSGAIAFVLFGASALARAFFSISGYIDIARGSSHILGIRLPIHFLRPLTSSFSSRDFWRRWQVTLMTWFRDYIYRPLRGAGASRLRRSVSLLAAFALIGLWHGPSYIGWGLMMALMQLLERPILRRLRPPRNVASRALRTALMVWLPLSLASMAFGIMTTSRRHEIVQSFTVSPLAGVTLHHLFVTAAIVLLVVLSDRMTGGDDPSDSLTLGRVLMWVAALGALVILGGSPRQAFRYVGGQ